MLLLTVYDQLPDSIETKPSRKKKRRTNKEEKSETKHTRAKAYGMNTKYFTQTQLIERRIEVIILF